LNQSLGQRRQLRHGARIAISMLQKIQTHVKMVVA